MEWKKMSKISVKTPNQLRRFLQVLAEESVGQARAEMDARSQQARIATDIKQSKSRFIQEEDPPDPAPTAPKAPEPPKAEPKPQAPAPAQSNKDSIEPKLGDLIDAINVLRGVPSAKDSNIEDLLRTYFDTLTTAEAAGLVVMIRSIASVMDGKIGAMDAKDPRDYDIETNFGKGSDNKSSEMTGKAITPTAPVSPEPTQGAEKIEPPIKVGQSQQVSESYRAKIRQLLNRS
jgi:hypothetical protein